MQSIQFRTAKKLPLSSKVTDFMCSSQIPPNPVRIINTTRLLSSNFLCYNSKPTEIPRRKMAFFLLSRQLSPNRRGSVKKETFPFELLATLGTFYCSSGGRPPKPPSTNVPENELAFAQPKDSSLARTNTNTTRIVKFL